MRPNQVWLKWVTVAWCSISSIVAIYAVCHYFTQIGFEFGAPRNVSYYETKDLNALHLPQWTPTNSIPLSPELAIKTAIAEVSKNHPSSSNWKLSRLELEQLFDEIWIYNISLMDGDNRASAHKVVRILMNGQVWQPKKKFD